MLNGTCRILEACGYCALTEVDAWKEESLSEV
jgi:hypothetical protein